MKLKYGFISADDHVQEHPEVWSSRMSKTKWGERIPHVEKLQTAASAGSLTADAFCCPVSRSPAR